MLTHMLNACRGFNYDRGSKEREREKQKINNDWKSNKKK